MSENTPQEQPKPTARPIPRPRPQAAPVKTPKLDDGAAQRAAAWGRVDEEGNVWLRSNDGERIVGQFAADGSPEDALALYVRRYLDLAAQVELLASRVENISPEEARANVKELQAQLVKPAVVGDVEALRSRVESLNERIAVRLEEVQAARQEAKAASLAHRTSIVERAEEISHMDPAKIHWRNTREEMTQLFEQWKQAQRSMPRIDRPSEEALWTRFSKARSHYDKLRRQHFQALDAIRAEAEAKKNAIIKRAEQIADSTDWSGTAAEFRSLMDQWRQAGRANHKEDNRLWEQFRTLQQRFFDAREAHFQERNSEYNANLELKLALIEEAEALLPVENLDAARAALRSIENRWDEIGPVPRVDLPRTEGRLREIEDAIREAEAEQWRRTDPTKQARSDGMAAQLKHLIAELDEEIAAAEAAGDAKKLEELHSARQARVAWLEQVTKEL